MRLLALAPLLALAAAQLDLDLDLDLDLSSPTNSLCPSSASTDTLWLADDSAFACAPLPSQGTYSLPGHHCITAPTAELSGKKDTCKSAKDCGGGVCVEVGEDMRRVCWTVASGGECQQFSKAT